MAKTPATRLLYGRAGKRLAVAVYRSDESIPPHLLLSLLHSFLFAAAGHLNEIGDSGHAACRIRTQFHFSAGHYHSIPVPAHVYGFRRNEPPAPECRLRTRLAISRTIGLFLVGPQLWLHRY